MTTDVSHGLKRAAGHPWFHHMSRVGLVARGLLYLLIGWLALQVAFGGGGKEADRTGALETVADKPGGLVLIAVMAVGFAALVLWQVAEALLGRPVPDGDKATKRLGSAGRAVIYAVAFAGTLAFLFGHHGSSSDKQSKTYTARLMEAPGGRWLVLAVAVGFAVYGAIMLGKAFRHKFMKELKSWEMGETARRVVKPLAIVGYTARGLVVLAAGAFFAYSAITFQPDKAQGLDGTLREFADTPAGPWGLVAIAFGVITFGLYSFCEARYRKVDASN
ncbi:DUF1206 domain-containing protein [Actinomadura sp. WMMA1423]|uniref:DUF1206 domain-containing protein n=1 Tax=Actinomadura sp. WMMA1423 TaxID=2591108 RepID=UPI001F0E7E2A|nr:DUF1206 domain-containing protein [Actinomadura sp. WMMA1423]